MTRRRGGKDEIGKGENRKTEARGTLSLRVKFKLKLPMQAERGFADLNFNSQLKLTRGAVSRARALGGLQGMDGGFDLWAKRVNRFAQVIGELDPQPIARRLAKIGGKMEIGFRGDPALLVDDFVDALLGKLRVFRQSVGREAHRTKKLLSE